MIVCSRYHELLENLDGLRLTGDVRRVVGLSVIASGPAVPVGELCRIEGAGHSMPALVTGFSEGQCMLQPLGPVDRIRAGDRVVATGEALSVPVGPGLIGRVIDALGNPLDGKGPVPGQGRRSVHAAPPEAYGRRPITDILETGVRVVDSCFTIGKGNTNVS